MHVRPIGQPVTVDVPDDIEAPWLDPHTKKVQLVEDWWCVVDGLPFCVPEGYITDWASIPKALNWLYPPDARPFRRAALFHDRVYSHLWPIYSKKFADKVFCELLNLDGVPWWRRVIFYAGVRVGGKGGWHRVKADSHPFWREQARRMSP